MQNNNKRIWKICVGFFYLFAFLCLLVTLTDGEICEVGGTENSINRSPLKYRGWRDPKPKPQGLEQE